MLKRLKVWSILGVLVTALAIAAAACDDNGTDDSGPSDETPSATVVDIRTPTGEIITPDDVLSKDPNATETATVKWGWMFEISGPAQVTGFGVPTGDGVKLAVQEINAAGGFQVGDTIYTIELIEKDTRSDVANTIGVAQELVQDDQVNVIFGPATLGETQATQTTQQAQVLHLCPCQQRETNALSSVEKAQGESRWAFQTLLPFSLLSDQGARNFIRDYPDYSTMSLICQNSDTGRDICETTRAAYENQGITVLEEIQYFPPGTTDYTPFLTSLQRADPDYLFNYDDPANTPAIVRQALELGIGRLHLVTVPATLAEALIAVELTVPVTAGAVGRQCAQPTSQEAADYCERYRNFLGVENLPPAEFVSLLTYDFVYMVAAAMQQAGTVDDTTAIAEALEQLHYDGVAEDDLFFNRRHLAVLGTDPCTVHPGGDITCQHEDPPPEAAAE